MMIALIGAVAAIAVALAFTRPAEPPAPKDTPTSEAAPAKPRICADKRARCAEVVVNNVGVVPYAFITGTKPGTSLVLFEAGGPGVDILSRIDQDHLGLPAGLEAADVLVISEPWTRTKQTPTCGDAVKSFGAAIALGPPAKAQPLTSFCRHLMWTEKTYTEAVQTILAKEQRQLAGIVGQSFGALPASAAAKAHPDAWLILNAPIAPPATTGASLITERGQALREALNNSYADTCAELRIDCHITGLEVVANAASRLTATTVEGRSMTVTAADVGLAAMSASYGLNINEKWLWKTLTDIPNVKPTVLSQLGRMADQVIQRYGSGDISTDLAAFVAGMCRSYNSWAPQSSSQISPPERLLAELQSQCQSEPAKATWANATVADRTGNVCLLGNTADPVSPAAWAERWKTVFPQAAIVKYRYKGHANLYEVMRATGTRVPCLGN